MPPQLATLLTVAFIVWLFRRDFREKPNVTGALWIPLLWMTINSSRFVSEWLNLFGLNLGAVNVEDGSPVDASVFALLIGLGLYVLNQRRISISEVVRNNRWLAVFFVYCFLSVLWSEFSFVALKRLLKVLGHPVMALVILTEPDLEEAVIRSMKRCAYVLFPVSILFIKYYPQWGRGFSEWTGEGYNTGITTNKNLLGLICFIWAVFFCWYLLKVWQFKKNKKRRNELIFIIAFLVGIGWLFNMAHSSTSLVSFLVAAVILVFLRLRWFNPRYVGTYLIGALLIGLAVEASVGVYESILRFLGKDPTLTDRTEIWNDLLHMQSDPIFGKGFESFWLGDHLHPLWEKWVWRPNQAHNGYLETYLNLGAVGLFLLLVWFIITFRKARLDLLNHLDWGRFRLGFLAAILCYSWTEAALKGTNILYFLFFLIAMDYPKRKISHRKASDRERSQEDPNLIHA